ncbi:hypothetical protein Ddc_20712 [Ditylenchus destructor]|nr:hypothetical protein Ddc_20712 [Ditylenchus destructor]
MFLTELNDALDDVHLPWHHILDFLFKGGLSSEGGLLVIRAPKPSNHHRDQMLEFLEQVKQKFLDSLAPVDFFFEWDWDMALNAANDEFILDDFVVENQRTKQCLRFHGIEFKLTVEKLDH